MACCCCEILSLMLLLLRLWLMLLLLLLLMLLVLLRSVEKHEGSVGKCWGSIGIIWHLSFSMVRILVRGPWLWVFVSSDPFMPELTLAPNHPIFEQL